MSEPIASSIVSASELVVDYGHHKVLDHATLAIHEGDRIGMVGRNGAGKTTFLKILAGDLEPDQGEIYRKRDLVTGYLSQSFELDEQKNVIGNILSGVTHIFQMIQEYELSPATSPQHNLLFEKINHFDGWTIDQRAKSLMDHLGVTDGTREVSTLSGGEKRRVALCRALLARPDFLILDEPTNHLDTESIEWLEDFLIDYPGSCIFVTHDRYFLDRIANRIVELSCGNFYSHTGSYTDFLEAKANRLAVEEQQEESRQRFLKRELEWVRRRPKARRTKSKDRVERFYTEAAKAGPEVELNVDLIIPPAPKLANRIVELNRVGMELGGRILFKDLSLKLEAGTRVGIVGRNGMGKTTLLKIIMGQLAPTSGQVLLGTQTRINYVDQGRLLLDEQKTIFEEVGEGMGDYVQLGDEKVSLRGYLRRFLFTEDRINAKIALLSGGERSRVILAKILKRGGNLIVLDEPTNDLDLSTLRLLEEALVAFNGTVLAVSHDRYFLNRICTDIVAFEGNEKVIHSVGGYDYYLERRALRQNSPTEINDTSTAIEPRSSRTRPRKLSYKEERELETIEAAILSAEAEVARIQALFDDPDFYKNHGSQWKELDIQLVAGKTKVTELYQRWEELEKIKNATSCWDCSETQLSTLRL